MDDSLYDDLLDELITYAGNDYDSSLDDFLLQLLRDAHDEIVDYMYQNGFASEEEENSIRVKVFNRYKSKIRKIAEFHYDKRGAEGASMYMESGKTITYESSGTPKSYFRGIVPIATIV